MTSVLLHGCALICYIASGVLYASDLALKTAARRRFARLLLLLGAAFHTVAIGAFCVGTHRSPFASGFGTLSVAAWAMALLYLPLEFFGRIPSLGAFALPVCVLLLFVAIARSHTSVAGAPDLRTAVVSLHVLLIVFSFAMFALAACCAGLYVWQYGLLKHPHRGGLFRRLPPLETVDSLAYHLVAFALPMLTFGLALGILHASSLHGNWMLDPKTILSFVVWLVYGIYLLARLAIGWRGTRLNYLLLVGMVVTIALYFIPSATHRFT